MQLHHKPKRYLRSWATQIPLRTKSDVDAPTRGAAPRALRTDLPQSPGYPMIRTSKPQPDARPSRIGRSPAAAACAVLSLLFAACSTPAPPQARLDLKLSDKFAEVVDADAAFQGERWWANFGDEELTRLVRQALEKNKNVKISLERVKSAQSGVTTSSSLLLPSVDAQLNLQRSSSGLPAPVKAAGQPDILGYQAGLQLSWEVDLSGALRAARDAAKSDLIAAQASVVGARLEVASEVAKQYFIYRSAEQRLSLLEALVQSQRQSAKFIVHRLEQGESSSYDLDIAESDVDALEQQVPALRSLCASSQAAMGTLLGENPSLRPIPSSPQYAWPKGFTIGSGQPVDLLRRRPDLLAAEARYSAESLRAVQARDQLWPRLVLSAIFGNEGLKLNALQLSPVHFENVAAAFAMPLFNSGRITAIADAQDAVASQMLMQWQNSVLLAVQEVESSLSVKNSEDARDSMVIDALTRKRSALNHAQSLFREGQVGRLTLLQAQRAELAAELDAMDSAQRRMLSYIQLYKALGGGWAPSRAQPDDRQAVAAMASANQRIPK